MNKKDSFILTSYNIHKGMSPLNRQVKMQGIAQALEIVAPDILCLQEVQGQHLKRNLQYNDILTSLSTSGLENICSCKTVMAKTQNMKTDTMVMRYWAASH